MGDETRRRIIEAAAAVFAEKGFHRASTRSICARAGVNAASVNYHFRSKAELYAQVVRGSSARMLAVARPDAPDDAADLPTRLRRYVASVFVDPAADPEAGATEALRARILAWEMLEPTGVVEDLRRDAVAPHLEILRAIVRDGLGPAAAEGDVDVVAMAIVGQAVVLHHVAPLFPALAEAVATDPAVRERTIDRLASFAAGIIAAERARLG